jgi:hypothetical protein
MATRASALREAPLRQRPSDVAGRAKPAKQSKPARPALGVVDRRDVLERARHRQARVLVLLSGLVIAGALGVVAVGHALVATDQLRADGLQAQQAAALATQQNRLLQRAQLETPSRILKTAEGPLKMVAPASVTYLPPVNPGESVAQAHSPKTKHTPPRTATGASSSATSSHSSR